MEFLGMGTLEILMVMLIALAIFGPQRMAGMARKMGRIVREISRAGSEFTRTLAEESLPKEEKQIVQEVKQAGFEVSQAVKEAGQIAEEAGREVSHSLPGSVPMLENSSPNPPPGPSVTAPVSPKPQTSPWIPKEPSENKPS